MREVVHDEAWTKDQIKRMLKEFKIWYFMPASGRFGKAGVPDFVCCVKGKFLGIETKTLGKKPTDIQSACHDKIRNSGGRVSVIDETGLASLRIMLQTM